MVWSIQLLMVMTGLTAGIIRGFTGFGGPATIIVVLTWFLTPIQVIDKVLIIEFVSAIYLFWRIRKQVDWRTTAALTIPAILSMPLGHWILLNSDAEVMRRAIAFAILFSCSLMLFDVRLAKKYPLWGLVIIGTVGGVVLGASYIALVVVAFILMGPYDKGETRTLLVVFGFFFASGYFLLSMYRGQTNVEQIVSAIPIGVAYCTGCWAGATLFTYSTETNYRRYALYLLVLLALAGLVRNSNY